MQKLIEFSTNDELALSMFPPVPASAAMPDWYKSLPLSVVERSFKNNFNTTFSAKGCVPIMDYLTSGYVLRLHTDVGFTVEESNGEEVVWWHTGSGADCIGIHSNIQLPILINGVKKPYVKFILPWTIKVPPGYSCLFYQPEFMFNEHLRLLPAIVDCDVYNQRINFPGYLLKQGTFKIDAGTPLIVVLPYKRDEWTSKLTLTEEFKPNPVTRFLERGYKKLFHNKKSFK